MTELWQVQRRHVSMMALTLKTFGNIVRATDVESARTYRDSGDGWTALEVLCHMRDFDEFFYQRAVMIIEQDHPILPAYDHEQIAIDRKYNEQDWYAVYDELVEKRERFREFFKSLTPEQWERTGKHPEREEPFTITDAAMQVGLHDVIHIEQMTRLLQEKLTAVSD